LIEYIDFYIDTRRSNSRNGRKGMIEFIVFIEICREKPDA